MHWKILLIATAGGLMCLDRVVLQAMISRPVVAGTLTGWMLGAPATGLLVGALIELFWIDHLPIGTYIPPNETIVTVLAVSVAVLNSPGPSGNVPRETVALSLLMFLPVAHLAQKGEQVLVMLNERLARQAVAAGEAGDLGAVSRLHIRAIGRYWLSSAGLLAVLLAVGVPLLGWLLEHLSHSVRMALQLTYFMFPVVGIAAALKAFSQKRALHVFCGVYLAAVFFLELFQGP
ncbi:MAG TPA: PTS sugar transporter subunit IIC [Syntrophales bacterium]|nr:PTS sugar transporter subunit IIC [Syntrophales bacterium]